MKVETYSPIDTLAPFIKRFMIIESDDSLKNNVLPDTSIVMAVRYKGSLSAIEDGMAYHLPAAVVTGLRRSMRRIDYSRDSAALLTIFREGGAAAFFTQPLHTLFGMSLPLEQLVRPHVVNVLVERLNEAKNNLQRIFIIQQFLISMLRDTLPEGLIIQTTRAIQKAGGNIRIKDLLENLPISRDPFEKQFRRCIGTSPKQFASIVRLRRLIKIVPNTPSLTAAAHMSGYFDQAHFTKDFKMFTGQSPTVFFKMGAFW